MLSNALVKTVRYMAAAVVLAVLMSAGVSEASGRKTTVPYGETCMQYGAPDRGAKLQTAMKSLREYFSKKGLEVKMLSHNKRFIRAEIYRGAEKVDRIVLDIVTGRMRSVD